MATAVNWTVAYTGADFSGWQAAFNGIGSKWTASSTGNLTGVSSSGTAIQLSTTGEAIATFTGTATGNSMAVTGVTGTIAIGQLVQGSGVPNNTTFTAGSGSTWTTSNVCTSSGAVLASGTDWVGHPLTISSVSNMITSYVILTRVATVSATSAYPTGTFGSAPTTGSAYSIADVAVTVTGGLSSAISNKWVDTSAGIIAPSIGMDATHNLTMAGNTAWNIGNQINYNSTGAINQPVTIESSTSGFNGLLQFPVGSFVTIQDLHVNCTAVNPNTIYAAGNLIFNRIWVRGIDPSRGGNAVVSCGGTGLGYNSIIDMPGPSNNGPAYATSGTFSLYNCEMYAAPQSIAAFDTPGGLTCVDCAVFGFNALSGTYTTSVADITKTGCTVLVPSAAVAIANTPFSTDLRTRAGGGMTGIGNGSAVISGPQSLDIYGASRPSTGSANVTAGVMQNAITVPATASVVISIVYTGGDYSTPVYGQAAPSSLTVSGSLATLTSATTLPWPVGANVQITVHNTAPNYDNDYIGTVTGTTTLTFPVTNIGAVTSVGQWYGQVVNTTMGQDMTWLQPSQTCGGNAADGTHIVLSSFANAVCVGHPITWVQNGTLTTTTCLILGYNSGTGVAVVGGTLGGYSSSFAATPTSADTYSIAPFTIRWNLGLAGTSNNTKWALDVYTASGGNQSGAVPIGGGSGNIVPTTITSPTSTWRLHGTTLYDSTQQLGTISGTGSAICIQNGGLTSPITPDHTATIWIWAGNGTIDFIQSWCANPGTQMDGALSFGGNASSPNQPVTLDAMVLRCDTGTADRAHFPIVGPSSPPYSLTVTRSAFVATNIFDQYMCDNGNYNLHNCVSAHTCNVITTSSSTVSSGSAITVPTITGILVGYTFVSHPNIPEGAIVNSTSGSSVPFTLNLSAALTGAVNSGDTLRLYSIEYDFFPGSNAVINATNTGFFGQLSPFGSLTTGTLANVVADNNRHGTAGMTIVSYPAAFNLASGQGQEAVNVDLRLPGSSPLIIGGTPDALVPNDIFGNAYIDGAGGRSIGPVQYITLAHGGAGIGFGIGGGGQIISG